MKKLFIRQTLGDKTNNSVLHTLIYFMTSYFILIFPPQTWNKQTKKCRPVKRENNFDRCLIGKSISHLHIKIICQCTLNISLPTQVFFAQFCTRCRENWKYSRSNFFVAPRAKIETESWQFNQLFFKSFKNSFWIQSCFNTKELYWRFLKYFSTFTWLLWIWIVMSSHRISP